MITIFTLDRSLVWEIADLQTISKNKKYVADWVFSSDSTTAEPLINIQLIVRDSTISDPVANIIDDTHSGTALSIGLEMSAQMETMMISLVKDYMKI